MFFVRIPTFIFLRALFSLETRRVISNKQYFLFFHAKRLWGIRGAAHEEAREVDGDVGQMNGALPL